MKICSRVLVGAIAIGLLTTTGIGIASAATTPTLVLSGGSAAIDGAPANIVATASAPGVVAFKVAGLGITGCDAVPTTTVAPFVAKCAWTATVAGKTALDATLTPTDTSTYTSVTAATYTVNVGAPVQGPAVSPIHIYVDTVVASGATGALAPKFGTGCSITSEFIVGQTIVFRVYGNNADLGGASLTPKNVAQAYITIPGVANPINLSYGNHGGVAFWTAILKTGTDPGLYNTLGVINFKVTMVAKDYDTIQVLATKMAPATKDGMRVKDANGHLVLERVTYFKSQKVSPPIKGGVGTWQSNFNAASQVTLNALPTS